MENLFVWNVEKNGILMNIEEVNVRAINEIDFTKLRCHLMKDESFNAYYTYKGDGNMYDFIVSFDKPFWVILAVIGGLCWCIDLLLTFKNHFKWYLKFGFILLLLLRLIFRILDWF